MFAKEKDFTDLKLGYKATIFDKDKNIQLNKRKGNFSLIKYTQF